MVRWTGGACSLWGMTAGRQLRRTLEPEHPNRMRKLQGSEDHAEQHL